MKKTISINIRGVVFNIEEDGYDKLRSYLAAIQKYFANYEDSQEIVADIESRVAERFLEKLKKEEKQALSLEDVDELIAAMGTVSDFEAIEDDEDLPKAAPGTQKEQEKLFVPGGGKKLVRDAQRKIAGGVCSGLAHYIGIDPVWMKGSMAGFNPVLQKKIPTSWQGFRLLK